MNTKLLKQKILDLAIRGKLTQQLKTDGTTADLLKEISSTCHSGAKRSGAIESKKSKNPEQIIPLDKSEAPFEIPPNWEWVCVDAIASLITDGEHLTPRRIESFEGYYLLSARNIQDNAIHLNDVDYVDEEEYNRISKRCNPRKDDVLISCSGSIGRVAVVKDDNKYVMVRSAAMIRPVLVHSYYLMYVLQSNCLQSQIQNYSKQTAQANLFQAAIRALQIPLPPLAEQQRIVAKIEEAFAEIDAIEKNKELLKTHIKQTRQKILDLAIHGKLVPQNKSDEPASVLLERITRGNPHYEKLGFDEVPFDIPENWCWCRLGDILAPMKSTSPKGDFFKYIDIDSIDNTICKIKAPKIIESKKAPSRASRFTKSGDILFSLVRPYLRNIAKVVENNCIASTGFFVCSPILVNSDFCYYLLISNFVVNGLNQFMKGDNSPSISSQNMIDFAIPLPSLAEQGRIVAKIEVLFSTLDQMERNLI